MLETTTCYLLVCDGCARRDDEGDFEPHYPTGDDAAARAEELEWTRDGDQVFCGRCRCRRSGDGNHDWTPRPLPSGAPVGAVWERCPCGEGRVTQADPRGLEGVPVSVPQAVIHEPARCAGDQHPERATEVTP